MGYLFCLLAGCPADSPLDLQVKMASFWIRLREISAVNSVDRSVAYYAEVRINCSSLLQLHQLHVAKSSKRQVKMYVAL